MFSTLTYPKAVLCSSGSYSYPRKVRTSPQVLEADIRPPYWVSWRPGNEHLVPRLSLQCLHLTLGDTERKCINMSFSSLCLCPQAEFQYIENSQLKVQVPWRLTPKNQVPDDKRFRKTRKKKRSRFSLTKPLPRTGSTKRIS